MTRRRVARFQAAWYLVSGIWPLVSMGTFELITGRKRDRWLVRTVGLLAAAFGVVLARQAGRRDGPIDPSAGVASAVAFGLADLTLAAPTQRPLPYLADGLVQAAIIAAWVTARE